MLADQARLDPRPIGADSPEPASAVTESAGRAQTAPATSHLLRDVAVYSVLRLALVAVLTAVLAFFMPLIVALLFAIIIQLPLAWLLFAGPRRRVNDAIARASAGRRAERARLQSALSGDPDTG